MAVGGMPEQTAARALADRIVAHGVGCVFGLAGISHSPLLFALQERGVRTIGARHETGAVGAADGYARVTGTIGFAFLISEQGLQNAITAISTAYQAATPVVVIATRFPDTLIEANADFVADQHDLVQQITKWRRTAPSAERVCEYFDMACKRASEGRPGPVILTLPSGMFETVIEAPSAAVPILVQQGGAAREGVERAASLFIAAKRPVIIAGSAAVIDRAGPALREFSTTLGIPVLGSNLGRGLVPEDDLMGFNWAFAQSQVKDADLVLVAGARMDMWHGYGMPPRFSSSTRFIHVDRTPEDIGRNRTVELALLGDIAETLLAIAHELVGRLERTDPTWLSGPLFLRAARFAALAEGSYEGLHTIDIGLALMQRGSDDRVLVCDGADTLSFMNSVLKVADERSYLDHHPMGSMGVCLPLAIGAAAGERHLADQAGRSSRPTVLVTGDGAVGFYVAELDTARRANLHLIVVVNNDGLWGTEFHGQQRAYGNDINTRIENCDYAMVARGFGCAASSVHDRPALDTALDAAFSTAAPHLIDVHVDQRSGRIRKDDPTFSTVIFDELSGGARRSG